MATEWYLMGSMPVYNSGYEKEEFNAYATDSFNEILETSPVSETIQIINHDLTLVSEIKVVVLNNVADSTTKSIERYLLATIGTLRCGDYISYDNKTWLITSFVGNNGMYEKAIMQLCNYTLKFQSPTGTILSYPCIDEASFLSGLDESKTITTLNGAHRIKLPFDDNTKLIGVDDRFFLDKSGTTTYKVTNVNNTSYNYGDKGLIELTLQQDSAYNATTDRVDLGVCNYFEPSGEVEPPVEGEYKILISANGNLYAGSTTPRTFVPTLLDSSNTSIPFTALWTFNYNGMKESDFTITYADNQCKIKVVEKYEYIGNYLTLICTTSDGLYSSSYDALITI